MDEESEDELSGENGWIQWFCGLKGHEFFAQVEEEYIRDNFNLCGLRGRFQYYDHALEMILSTEAPDDDDLNDMEFVEINRDAADLYGLIHSRYIISPHGLQDMREKYLKGSFGTCPRVHCDRQHVLPIGWSEDLRTSALKIFCPKCEEVYTPRNKHKDVDGLYFGSSFPQVFLQTYPVLIPHELPRPFVPRVFGFRVHQQKSIITRKLEDEQAAPSNATKPAKTEKPASNRVGSAVSNNG